MRSLLSLCAILLALAPLRLIHAAESDADADDIVILSVKPRSPDVRPITMSVPADGRNTAVPQQDKVQRIASSVSNRLVVPGADRK